MPTLTADQNRRLLLAILRNAVELAETEDAAKFPPVAEEGTLTWMQHGSHHTDPRTNQRFFSLVFVLVADSPEEIARQANILQPPGG